MFTRHSHNSRTSTRNPAKTLFLLAKERPCTTFHRPENKWPPAGDVTRQIWLPRVAAKWTLLTKKCLRDFVMRSSWTNSMCCLTWDTVLTLWIDCKFVKELKVDHLFQFGGILRHKQHKCLTVNFVFSAPWTPDNLTEICRAELKSGAHCFEQQRELSSHFSLWTTRCKYFKKCL